MRCVRETSKDRFLPVHLPPQRDQLMGKLDIREVRRINLDEHIHRSAQRLDRTLRREQNTNSHILFPRFEAGREPNDGCVFGSIDGGSVGKVWSP